ncbi:aminotransferase class I/II-fold pyridoxal phosphate-dependent enzyme [Coralliovum pocilloporae]|uniref:aminotransferase class I/II-fold pyridoxal phosphate-dependent enzyme n=1 Tax=Coralliovum pocilloporae TaxID=3066369 RepID=UPI003306F170
MARSDRRKLSEDRKAAALKLARQSRAGQSDTRAVAERVQTVPGRSGMADFKTLTSYQELQLQKTVGQLLNLDSPYFREHDGLAGATSVMSGRTCLNFSTYDYLGLNGHPEILAAASDAMAQYGISASASRIVAGERPIHAELEQALADFYNVESAVAFVSGHATNVSTIDCLLGEQDLILHDSFIHNSIVTGARLSGAARQVFPHGDYDALERILSERASQYQRILIVVEGVYSMDGDFPDLPRLLGLKERYNAWLMVDEAHSLGVLGKTGRGLAEHFGVDPSRVDIWMGTFSKSLAGCGGYIAGSAELIELIKYSAAGFVFSVGLPPLLAASVLRALQLLTAEPERVANVQRNGRFLLETLQDAGFDIGPSQGYAVVPVMLGDSAKAGILAVRMLERGVNVLPIIYPAVPEKSARLRFFVTCYHTEDQMREAVRLLSEELKAFEANPPSLSSIAKIVQQQAKSQ